MLRDGPRAVHARPGMTQPRAGRRRRAQLRRQRPAAARGAVRRHLDSAGGRRRRRRARRRAVRRGTSCSSKPRDARSRRSPAGQLPRAAVLDRPRSARSSTASGATYRRAASEAELLEQVADLLADGEDRRLVPGPDGVRPARARRAQHPRRSALAEDAGDDEPEDQVPRELPAVRAGRAARARRTSGSSSTRRTRARTCCSSRRCSTSIACRSTDEQRATMANDPDLRNRVNMPRSDDPGRDARRLQRAAADRGRRPQPAAARGCCEAFHERTGCPVLVNTSFNVRGEPIVCTPEDAYRCFLGTEMDALVLEDVILLKDDVAEQLDAADAREVPGAVPAGLKGAVTMQWSDVIKPPAAEDAPAVRRAVAAWSSAAWRPGAVWHGQPTCAAIVLRRRRARRRRRSGWSRPRPSGPIYTGWMIVGVSDRLDGLARRRWRCMFYRGVHAGRRSSSG